MMIRIFKDLIPCFLQMLIMHRNTLVYRLDKIQKATGLDLRHFQDAVQFKVLMELRKLLEINRTE